MWFRNLYLYKLEKPFTISAEELQLVLQNHQLNDCPPGQRETLGWTSPFGRNNDMLVLANQSFYLIRMAKQERILPVSVIKDHLLDRVEKIESRDDRKVGNKERRELKEELEFELLPKAFTKTTHTDAWIDCINSRLVINTSTAAKAETLAKLLRNCLGDLRMVLPETESSPMAIMTNWLNTNQLPRSFEFGQECLFKSVDDQMSTVTFRKHELLGNEPRTNLDAGKFVSQIELIWQQKVKFILTEDLILKRLKFLDIMADDFEKQGFETPEDKIDAEFALMIGEVTGLLNMLFDELGTKK